MSKDCIKVYLLVGNLPLYREMLRFPPSTVIYHSNIFSEGAKSYYSKINEIKRRLTLAINSFFMLPRIIYVKNNFDVIHSNRGICILNKTPWVIDIDHPSAFIGFSYRWKYKRYRRIPERFLSSYWCKKIIPWSFAAMKAIFNSFPNNRKIKEKTEILYPATHPYKGKIKEKEYTTLLYVSSLFKEKGGLEVLRAFEILRKKFDLKLIVKSDVPEDIKKRYNYPEIEYHPYRKEILPREELLNKFFSKSDIFIYPTYCDIFGLCLLDALSVGLPIVSTNVFAVPEIVEDGKNGFLINSPITWHDDKYFWSPRGGSEKDRKLIVNQLVEKTSLLIEDSSLRRKMGRYGRKLVEKGKFSIEERNKKLKRIYEEAIS